MLGCRSTLKAYRFTLLIHTFQVSRTPNWFKTHYRELLHCLVLPVIRSCLILVALNNGILELVSLPSGRVMILNSTVKCQPLVPKIKAQP